MTVIGRIGISPVSRKDLKFVRRIASITARQLHGERPVKEIEVLHQQVGPRPSLGDRLRKPLGSPRA